MSQDFSLYGTLSARENLEFFTSIHRVPPAIREQRIDRLFRFSRLEPFLDRLADHLSGGMKKKLALCCTLIHTPAILILDEPTTGVDPFSRRELWQILADFFAEGMTMVLSTPYIDETERIGLEILWTQIVAMGSLGTIILLLSIHRFQQRME